MIEQRLPEPVAFAVLEFINGALLENPHRVGKRLGSELAGAWSARRGTYRVISTIDEEAREVVVLHVDHRRNVYRPR
nr:type II toxin-antitoxin system RelE/ParE family toxin [Actinomycetales bacterium]